MRSRNLFGLVIVAMLGVMLGGCGMVVAAGSGIATTALLEKVHPDSKKTEAAQIAIDIADDLDAITDVPPDFSAIYAKIDAKVASSKNPYAIPLGEIAKTALRDAENFIAATTGPKSAVIRQTIKEVAAGMRLAGLRFVTPAQVSISEPINTVAEKVILLLSTD